MNYQGPRLINLRSVTTDQVWQRDLYTDEEREFLQAVDRFRTENSRVPTEVEGFRIAKALGWRKAKE